MLPTPGKGWNHEQDPHPKKDGRTQVCSTEPSELAAQGLLKSLGASKTEIAGKNKSEFLPRITWIWFYCFTVSDEHISWILSLN